MDTFNSRNTRYRSPLGAVPSGVGVSITVRPESYRFPISGFIYLEYEATGKEVKLEMNHNGTEGEHEVFTCNIETTDYTGLIWYHFRFENEGGFFYYGNNYNMRGGPATFYGATKPPRFQLTVYDGSYKSPNWFNKGICYHIFPDRFHRTEVPDESQYADRQRIIRKDWYGTPYFLPESNGEVTNRDFFGGNLQGIIEKLDFLEDIGVSCIYLSPIFEAFSNHRYDTADYSKIDPMLGDASILEQLCTKARERGIRVILDGVFNHTGFDSVYFNGLGRYSSLGAHQSTESPFYDWYSFEKWPDKYISWWGIKTLPQVDESNESYLNFIVRSSDSILRKWLRLGVSGWRLDVADELPDSFIAQLNTTAKQENPEAIVIGEVWEDASHKISYGKRREYLLGGALDSVTNYPFRSATVEFVKGGPSKEFVSKMGCIIENYPPYALKSAMNILGTHDTPRILSVLGNGLDSRPRHQEVFLDGEQRARAVKLLKIASLIQYTFVGTPCVYYGDEAGMEGFEDPLNRRGYIWGQEDQDILAWYKNLGVVRRAHNGLQDGDIEFLCTQDSVLAYVRRYEDECIYVLCNRSDRSEKVLLPKSGVVMYYDIINKKTVTVTGEGEVEIPPQSPLLLKELNE